MFRHKVTSLAILVVLSLFILACGDNESPVTELVVAPEPIIEPINLSPPVIKKIVVPDQIHAGARIKLEAVAEDPDGNALTYNWEASGNLLYTKTMSIAIWTPPPIDLGVTTINVTVNDGIYEVTKSADVSVIHSLIVPGEQAGGIRLGAPLHAVIDIYGEPSHRVKVGEGKFEVVFPDQYEWDTEVEWKNAGLTIYLRNNRVYVIEIGAPNTAQTTDGITIGTNCDDAGTKLGLRFGGGPAIPNIIGGGGKEYYPYNWAQKGIGIHCYMSIIKWIVIYEKEEPLPGTILQPWIPAKE